ncbi:MAG: PQQ-binding-like beta-propeller repeat protein [Chloroflexi bacterium]|nr:PQQ-binding-like beta-propeller repeat protein [Chloroflexota bacterium]
MAVWRINGEPAWQMQIGEGSVTTGPVIGEGVIYVILSDKTWWALCTPSTCKHKTSVGAYQLKRKVTLQRCGVIWVYVADLEGLVTAVEQNSGSARWEFPTTGSIFSAPAIADGHLYVGSWDKNLYALDAGARSARMALHSRRRRLLASAV